tara:strand:+ start:5412 stop:5648 length:237 start_codon:yes stop_codon:yes gene_type:complete
MTEEKKDSKKCKGSKKAMIAYGFFQIGSSFVSALSLGIIAFSLCSIKYQSKSFNSCVEEMTTKFGNSSEAVRYCNGGN